MLRGLKNFQLFAGWGLVLILFCLLVLNGRVLASQRGLLGQSLKYVCYRTHEKITLDGVASETSWSKVNWTEDFVDIQGAKMPKPRFKTHAKMLWDEQYFYVLIEMKEPHLWATYRRRDSVIFHENDIEMFIDPDGDTHGYYELEINALGTVWDLLLLRPYRDADGASVALNSWDMRGLKVAVKLHGTLNDPSDKDTGWVVELAIPWGVFSETHGGKPPVAGSQWRVNFSRVEWALNVRKGKYTKQIDPKTGKPRSEDNWVWSPQGVINMHQPESWGRVQFSSVVAGAGREAFQPRREDVLKDVMREIYYAQAEHKKRTGQYARSLGSLMSQTFKQRWLGKLSMLTDAAGYRAILKEGELVIAIDQTGRVWRVKK